MELTPGSIQILCALTKAKINYSLVGRLIRDPREESFYTGDAQVKAGSSSDTQRVCPASHNHSARASETCPQNRGWAGRARAAEAGGQCDSETIICNVNQSSIQPEIIYVAKFLTVNLCLLEVSMDFGASNTGITKCFFPTALLNMDNQSTPKCVFWSTGKENMFVKCPCWSALLLPAAEMLTGWSMSRFQNSKATSEISSSSKHKVCLHLLHPTSLLVLLAMNYLHRTFFCKVN